MEALTVRQPWAQLLATGAKRFETRSRSTRHRGPIAIHAGRMWRGAEAVLCWRDPFREALEAAGVAVPPRVQLGTTIVHPRFLPLGVVLAVARIVDCVPCWPRPGGIDERERAFGDWGPGRFAWELRDPVMLAEPVPALGMLGRFRLADEAAKAVARQLHATAEGRS